MISNYYQAKSPALSPFKNGTTYDSKKYKEDLHTNSFLEGANSAIKKSEIDKRTPSSYFHRHSAYINPDISYLSRGKLGRSPLQIRSSVREVDPSLRREEVPSLRSPSLRREEVPSLRSPPLRREEIPSLRSPPLRRELDSSVNKTQLMRETYTHPPSVYKNSEVGHKSNFIGERVQ